MTEKENQNKQRAHDFYHHAIRLLNKAKIPYLLGGAFSLYHHTGVYRNTKDLDVFCKAGDYPAIIKVFTDEGFEVEITDSRWLAKIFYYDHFIDIIFNTSSNLCTVDEEWFTNATKGEVYGEQVLLVSPEELIWMKIYVQNRERYDAADINHIILKCGKDLNWKLLRERMDNHWLLLLQQLVSFMFVYPTERNIIPQWLFEELLDRAKNLYEMPLPQEKVCLGPVIDHTSYKIDITDWGFKSFTIRTI